MAQKQLSLWIQISQCSINFYCLHTYEMCILRNSGSPKNSNNIMSKADYSVWVVFVIVDWLIIVWFVFVEIQDEKEAIQVLFSLIEKLPKVHHDVLERLIFHLAR